MLPKIGTGVFFIVVLYTRAVAASKRPKLLYLINKSLDWSQTIYLRLEDACYPRRHSVYVIGTQKKSESVTHSISAFFKFLSIRWKTSNSFSNHWKWSQKKSIPFHTRSNNINLMYCNSQSQITCVLLWIGRTKRGGRSKWLTCRRWLYYSGRLSLGEGLGDILIKESALNDEVRYI